MLGFKKNVLKIKKIKTSPWRKVSLATWKIVDDSSVHGLLRVNADNMLEYINQLNKESQVKITFTHIMIKVCALTLDKYPQANSFIRYGKLYQREDTDIFVHIAADMKGDELTGTVIRNANLKSIKEIADELNNKASEYKNGKRSEFDQIKLLLNILPSFILRPVLQCIGFILYTLNIWSPVMGMQRDPFAGIMLTNVGSLGIDWAYTPLARYSRVSFLLAMGSIQDTFKFDNESVHPSKEINLTTTFDHRVLDGVHAAKIAHQIREYFKNPHLLD